MRENGWDSLFGETFSYCVKHDIVVPNMDDLFRTQGRSQRMAQKITNLHCFRVALFYAILDMQFKELSNCFNETNTDSFAAFDK